MIDWARVGDLRDEIGKDDFADVVELFLEEVLEVVGRLATAPNHETLGSDLHFLKGSALNLGFSDFAARCQNGENLSSSGDCDQVDLAAILTAFDQSRDVFLSGLKTRFSA